MRDSSTVLGDVLAGDHSVTSSLTAVYDGQTVMDGIPVSGGTVSFDNTRAVQGSLQCTVPRYVDTDDGNRIDMLPRAAGDPLSSDGTWLNVTYRVGYPGDGAEALNLGWYRIDGWDDAGSVINVTASSLESIVADARLLSSVQSPSGAVFPAIADILVGDLLPLVVNADPTRAAGASTYEDDRLNALLDLAAAWPARLSVNDSGAMVIDDPFNDAADPIVAVYTDGVGGTVVDAPTSGSRQGIYNAVKATAEPSGASTADVVPISSVIYLTDGPRRWNGPYGNVPYFMSSPLLTTFASCQAAARTRLQNLQALAQPVSMTIAPDPRLQLGDVIGLRKRGERDRVLRIDSWALPLTFAGAMAVTGHVLAGRAIA